MWWVVWYSHMKVQTLIQRSLKEFKSVKILISLRAPHWKVKNPNFETGLCALKFRTFHEAMKFIAFCFIQNVDFWLFRYQRINLVENGSSVYKDTPIIFRKRFSFFYFIINFWFTNCILQNDIIWWIFQLIVPSVQRFYDWFLFVYNTAEFFWR